MSNIIDLPVITRLDIDPDKILNNAIGQLENVIIIGEWKDGEEYFASSAANGPDILWAIERAKKTLLEVMDE